MTQTITIQVVNRGEPVRGASVVVGETVGETSTQGRVQCPVPSEVQLIHVQHEGVDVKRWVLPDTDDEIVIDLASRGPAESLVESLVGDRYRFLEVLGRGGMGVVIKAHDSLLNRVVAIKMLAGELETNEEAQRIFLEEARSLAPLSHPNLVSIHDIQHLQGHTLMVLEFVVGENLDRRLNLGGPLSTATALRYVIQMARAASFMHTKGFIHRDLKPGNVIVGEDDSVKIIDFGLARSLDAISAKGTQIRGTPAYMAPEQIRGAELTPKVDAYQLGITLFELLTGDLPFKGDMGYAHVHREPPTLSEVLPNVNPDLSVLVAACLAKAPAQRPSAKELLDELQALYVITADELTDAISEVERIGGEQSADWRRTTGGRLARKSDIDAGGEQQKSFVIPLVVIVMLIFGGIVAAMLVRPQEPAPALTPPTVEPKQAAPAPIAVANPLPPPEMPPPDAVESASAADAGTDGGLEAATVEEVVEVPVAPKPKPRPRPVAQPKPRPKPTPVADTAPEPTPKPSSDAPAIRTTRRSNDKATPKKTGTTGSSEIRLSR